MRFYRVVLSILICCVLLTGCLSNIQPQEIESGFSEELVQMLADLYEMAIPDSAVFVKGYFDNAMRDPTVWIVFEIDESDLDNMLSDAWRDDTNSYTYDADVFDHLVEIDVRQYYTYTGEMFTYLYCSAEVDGKVTCAFHGRHPGNAIR